MTVEIITNNPNEILDLTGGSNAEASTENDAGQEQVLDTTLEKDNTDDVITDPAATEALDADGNPIVTDPADANKDDVVDSDKPEYFFGEQQVDIEVPDEISTALADAGIDQKALLEQLFKKDGDFSIDDATRTKLEDKFGKVMVDGYLNMYKGLNEQSLSKFASDAEAATLTETKQGEEYASTVGGEEGLVLMEDYLVSNYDENQLSAYNAVMENGDHASQILIISQVKREMALNDKLINGDKSIKLTGDSDAANSGIASPLDKGFLTKGEYDSIMNSPDDKYWTDTKYMNQVDSARRAGFKHDA